MDVRILCTFVAGVALAVAARAQDAPTPPSGPPPAQGQGGQRGGGRGGWGGGMGMGRGLMGTVTEVAADHYTIKTDAGETYTVHTSVNTRILKQQARMGGERGEGGPGGGNPPTPLKSTDIKVGDAIAVMGETDAAAKSIGAVMILQMDPEQAKQMRTMQANYGKTWLMGKVTGIKEVEVTLDGAIDHTAHSFSADENTTFRKRRDPITLADLQVGDNIRVEGALKEGKFIATTVVVMGMPGSGATMVPRPAAPPAPDQPPAPPQAPAPPQ